MKKIYEKSDTSYSKQKCKNCEDLRNGSIVIHDNDGRCGECKKYISTPIFVSGEKKKVKYKVISDKGFIDDLIFNILNDDDNIGYELIDIQKVGEYIIFTFRLEETN